MPYSSTQRLLTSAFDATRLTGAYLCLADLPSAGDRQNGRLFAEGVRRYWMEAHLNIQIFPKAALEEIRYRATVPVFGVQHLLHQLCLRVKERPLNWQPCMYTAVAMAEPRLHAFRESTEFTEVGLRQTAFDAAALLALALFFNWDDVRQDYHAATVFGLLKLPWGAIPSAELCGELAGRVGEAKAAALDSSYAELPELEALFEDVLFRLRS